MREAAGLVGVWTLTLSLPMFTGEASMRGLREKVWEVADREASASISIQPFIWRTRGAVLTVRTQGDPFPLLGIAEWALENCSPEPQGFQIQQSRTSPLVKAEGWQGYGRD
jgi:hypothetical protein